MVLVGAAAGAALFVVVWLAAQPRPSPLTSLARFDAAHAASEQPTPAETVSASRSLAPRLGGWLAEQARHRGWRWTSLRQDLALSGRSLPDVLGRKVILAVCGLVGTLALLVGTQILLEQSLPVATVAVASLGVAAGLFFLPDVQARAVAARRRAEFRRCLSAYLDLVSLEMAGSAAPGEALPNAARVGAGWPLALIADTLYRATRSGRDQWTALSELGSRIGVDELRDLGQLVGLVAKDGARVRRTLTARAATMRRRELADLAERSGKQDNSMRLAQALIAVGFVVFIGYPAVAAVMAF
jgi:Flp pilus assembly protein TadB